MSIKNLKPGDQVWVLERDEYGDCTSIYGAMFLTQVGDYVIASSFIWGMEGADQTLAYHARRTCSDDDTSLMVFRETACFETREEAQAALDSIDDDDLDLYDDEEEE